MLEKIIIFMVVFSMFFVQVEPAPYDLLMVVLIGAGLMQKGFPWLGGWKIPGVVWLGLLILANLISLVYAGLSNSSIFYFGVTVYLIITAVFWSVYPSDREKFQLVIQGYMAAVLAALALGFISFLWDMSLLERFVYYNTRMMSGFKDPNVFAAFLVPAFIISMWKINLGEYQRSGVLFTSLIIAGIVLSFSRGAWVSAFISAVIYVLFSFRTVFLEKWKQYLGAMLGAIIIAGMVLTVTGSWEFFWSRFGFQSYDADRFAAQERGLRDSSVLGDETGGMEQSVDEELVALSAFLGIGPGQYNDKLGYAAHSLYIRTLRENGWIGIFSLVVFIVVLFKRLLLGSLSSRESVFPMLLSIFIGMLVLSFVIDTVHWRHFWLFTGLCMGLLFKHEDCFRFE
ncbi:MAG: hypothetical protein PHY90_08595 [Desulfitobacteriaceae bacterium]|nr:hypothetical protein [Desulfitobacteriaceae bacterium]